MLAVDEPVPARGRRRRSAPSTAILSAQPVSALAACTSALALRDVSRTYAGHALKRWGQRLALRRPSASAASSAA